MSITKFSDISGLTYYINAGESAITPGPSAIETITSVTYTDDDAPIQVDTVFSQRESNTNLQRVDNAVDQLSGFDSTAGGCPFSTTGVFREDALCFVCVIDTGSAPEGILFDVGSTNAGAGYIKGFVASNRMLKFVVRTSTQDSDVFLEPNQQYVIVMQWQMPKTTADPDGAWEIWVNGGAAAAKTGARSRGNTHGMKDVAGLFDQYAADDNFTGSTGMFLFYNRTSLLNQVEVADITALAQTWITTGAGPEEEVYPPNCSFQASTNDPLATLSWVHSTDQEAEPETWVDVGTVSGLNTSLSSYNGQANGQLNVDSATDLGAAGWVACKAVTAYATKYSSPAQLEIRDQT